jgi:hypothetical protein
MCQTLTGQVVWQVVWQVVRRDGDQVDGKWKHGRRVTLWDPSVVLVQTQQEACGRLKIYTHVTFCTTYRLCSLGVGLENKSGTRPCGTR